MKLTTIFAISISLLAVACSNKNPSASDGKHPQYTFPTAAALNDSLGHGINLGNALDAPVEGDWGVTLQEDYFTLIADSGFKSVRIPISWSTHSLTVAPYTIDSTFLKRVRWAVDLALAKSLRVVINMHHYNEMMTDPEGQEARFLSMWTQISTAFVDYPPELIFELLNEPKDQLTSTKWNTLLAKAITTVRAIQPERTLMIGTAQFGGIGGLNALELPSDTNLIVTVHYYEPHQFTHQGASFEPGADVWLGKTWRASPAERSVVDNDLNNVVKWAKDNHRPVFMGEFGTYFKVDSTSRAFYTEYLAHRMDSLGLPWALWNFSSDFGIYNDTTKVIHQYLTQALLHPGHNAALDSAMATGVHVDLSKYILLDAFDTHPEYLGVTETGWLWANAKGLPGDSSHGTWFAYYTEQSSMLTHNGDSLVNIIDVQTDSALIPNFPLAIGDWGNSGKGIYINAHLLGTNYPSVGFGASFTGWRTLDHFYDLCALTAISFKAKGKGEWWLQMITDTVENHYPADSNWGHFGTHFNLESEWQDYIITVDNLLPKKWSVQETDSLQWKNACKLTNEIQFMNGQSYGKIVDENLEIYIDDIRLIGMDPLPIRP